MPVRFQHDQSVQLGPDEMGFVFDSVRQGCDGQGFAQAVEGIDGGGFQRAPRVGFGHEARREHQPIEFDIRFAECDIGESHRFQGAVPPSFRGGCGQRGGKLLEPFRRDRFKQRVAVGEMSIGSWLAYAGKPSQRGERHRLRPTFRDLVARDSHQRPPQIAVMIADAAGGLFSWGHAHVIAYNI